MIKFKKLLIISQRGLLSVYRCDSICLEIQSGFRDGARDPEMDVGADA